jgi:pimeloyl-ACP methyl ester carboxylesterase
VTCDTEQVPVQTRYARSGDVSLAYQVTGEGPFDIVFVPGALSHIEMAWEVPPFRELFERLASFARLIIFDKRGTGMSDRVEGAPPLETRMDDVRAVMDAAGSERAAIVGASDGVPMSILFAATYPERTGALVLYGGFARWLWAPDFPWGTPEAESLQQIADERVQSAEPGYHEQIARQASPNAGDEEIAALARYFRYGGSPGADEALSRMNMSIDVRHVLPSITTPTLVLHCAGDPWCDVRGGRDLARRIPSATYVELPGDYHVPAAAEMGTMTDEIERFLRATWDEDGWAEAEQDRMLATILFTDIVGSTARLAELGDHGWQTLLEKHHGVVRRQLSRFRGRELDTAGDGFFASFDGPARGIRCARAISQAVAGIGLEVRAGLHTGECQLVDGKFGGIAVHIGARVAAEAKAGEVLVSSTVKDLVAGSGIQFDDRGVHALKGVPGEWRLYGVEG